MDQLPSPSTKFQARKNEILSQLAVPTAEYTDASPKGSVDEGIRHLIAEINGHEGLVTTSSCAGRVSVFLEGAKKKAGGQDQSREEARASAGGKGGGAWLYVSHDPVDIAQVQASGSSWAAFLGVDANVGDGTTGNDERLIHFKFEPMILHLLTASNEHAQLVLRCAFEAGFRESGALNISEKRATDPNGTTPMVAVRTMGLLFESLIGSEHAGTRQCLVTEAYLDKLVSIANERFVENQKRIERFRSALSVAFSTPSVDEQWEPKEMRLQRKRAEGLKRQEEARRQKEAQRTEDTLQAEVDLPLNEDGIGLG